MQVSRTRTVTESLSPSTGSTQHWGRGRTLSTQARRAGVPECWAAGASRSRGAEHWGSVTRTSSTTQLHSVLHRHGRRPTADGPTAAAGLQAAVSAESQSPGPGGSRASVAAGGWQAGRGGGEHAAERCAISQIVVQLAARGAAGRRAGARVGGTGNRGPVSREAEGSGDGCRAVPGDQ